MGPVGRFIFFENVSGCLDEVVEPGKEHTVEKFEEKIWGSKIPPKNIAKELEWKSNTLFVNSVGGVTKFQDISRKRKLEKPRVQKKKKMLSDYFSSKNEKKNSQDELSSDEEHLIDLNLIRQKIMSRRKE